MSVQTNYNTPKGFGEIKHLARASADKHLGNLKSLKPAERKALLGIINGTITPNDNCKYTNSIYQKLSVQRPEGETHKKNLSSIGHAIKNVFGRTSTKKLSGAIKIDRAKHDMMADEIIDKLSTKVKTQCSGGITIALSKDGNIVITHTSHQGDDTKKMKGVIRELGVRFHFQLGHRESDQSRESNYTLYQKDFPKIYRKLVGTDFVPDNAKLKKMLKA